MSLMFMLFALLGAVVVLGGGFYGLRLVVGRMEARGAVVEPEPPRSAPRRDVGGYVPAPREADELPAELRSRVHNLIALGCIDEAVRAVREHLDGDEGRARGIVRRLGGGRAALEP
ncbi:hypothetical protein [Nocardiopsis nanhaiensis]